MKPATDRSGEDPPTSLATFLFRLGVLVFGLIGTVAGLRILSGSSDGRVMAMTESSPIRTLNALLLGTGSFVTIHVIAALALVAALGAILMATQSTRLPALFAWLAAVPYLVFAHAQTLAIAGAFYATGSDDTARRLFAAYFPQHESTSLLSALVAPLSMIERVMHVGMASFGTLAVLVVLLVCAGRRFRTEWRNGTFSR